MTQFDLIGEDFYSFSESKEKVPRQLLWVEREADQLLVSSHDDQTFNVYAISDPEDVENQNKLRIVETFRENGGTIYEMDVMNYKESSILLTACKDQPVHLRSIDADGKTTLLSQ